MKRCENCGWTTANSEDMFCENCGGRLVEVPEAETEDSGRKKSVIPIIVGCAAAVVLIIAGTVVCIGMLGGEKQEQTVQTAETAEEEEQGSGGTSSGEAEQKKEDGQAGEEEDQAGAAREEIQDFQVPDSGGEESSESDGQDAEKEDQTAAAEDENETDEGAAQKAAGDGETQTSESSKDQKYETCFVVNCQESITLRKSPSTKAGEYCQIPLGAAVSYVGTAENGFYQVIYNGQTGYALASYLSFENGEDSQQEITYMEVVNCRESITLRKTPSTRGEEFCQIPLGAVVEYKGTAENGFYMVAYNGYTGYALASYLTER